MVDRVKTFGPTQNTANTKTQIGSDYNVPKMINRIKGLIIQLYNNAVEDMSGYITLELDNVKGPFEIPLPSIVAITSGVAMTPIIIPLNIDGVGGSVLSVYATITAQVEKVTVGVIFE